MYSMVVIGASTNPSRYSYHAVKLLIKHNYNVVPIGIKNGSIENCLIQIGQPAIADVHSVILYIGLEKQKSYYQYILDLKPKRVIFNPGTGNVEFAGRLDEQGIEVVFGCAIVMLNSGIF